MNTNAPAPEEQESPLDPDEPHTPAWFTFLGVGLFLLGGIFVLATSGDEEETPAGPSSQVGEDAPALGGEGEPPPAQQPPPAAAAADPHAGHGHD